MQCVYLGNIKSFSHRLLTRHLSGVSINRLYKQSQATIPFTENERNTVNNALLRLCNEQKWISTLYTKGIPAFMVNSVELRERFIEYIDNNDELRVTIRTTLLEALNNLRVTNSSATDVLDSTCETLTPYLSQYMQNELPRATLAFHGAKHLADLTRPLEGYQPRSFRRKVIAHLGPPNSGKTYEAHLRLLGAKSGVYCAPLRLLAWEMQQRLQDEGIQCSLLTGQDVSITTKDTHMACTVEMTQLNRDYGCAVIDEMQMIGDSNRGFAWTRAFLGLRTPELHICGSTSCYLLAKSFCNMAGDLLEVKEHTRLGTVSILDEPVKISDLLPGDCIVCFARNTALRIATAIERQCFKNDGSKPASTVVIYGSLPPETRKQQINDFNSRKKQILVASDVIGMGVNVRIKRVIFHSLTKYDGSRYRMLTAAEVQQIAGRAGRYSLNCGNGYVGCTREDDIVHLKRLMRRKEDQLESAYIAPSTDTLSAFIDAVRGVTDPPGTLSECIKIYRSMAQSTQMFKLLDMKSILKVANALSQIELPTRTIVEYLFVPLGSQPALQLILRTFALSHSVVNNVKLRNVIHEDAMELLENCENFTVQNIKEHIRQLEMLYQILDAYVWLGYKFPDVYVDHVAAASVKGKIARTLHERLEQSLASGDNMDGIPETDDDALEAVIARQLIRSH
ncbi:Mitochondrial degradasome RNA helicase subunit C terminal family protein [Babesia bovis T2Bo]|uniref:RNA helicase n=1 Tax=Babesia bovis TaxID=5865 RepID=A7ASH4_BABBO|nr:Mitochondrial degradasome RNA helicase subunit C terminal family protein [Babesia bovis T2Bo]EDO07493.1 Mitochondrial degradasome RNA helicase subunit C terminal family protein [Babesia bovis T2Bo]|eukprot:XP_001611061.1 ATP-dependent RNA helicase [Babesia bovis T2Bo]